MPCSEFREAVSARLDGEPLGMPARELDEHLAACAGCAAGRRMPRRVTRRARLAPAPPVPDLTAAVLAASAPGAAGRGRRRPRRGWPAPRCAWRCSPSGSPRPVLAWPALASGTAAMSAPVHMAHETGAWNLAVAAAFLAVAAGPRLAAGALPFLGTFAALLVPVTVADLGAGHVHARPGGRPPAAARRGGARRRGGLAGPPAAGAGGRPVGGRRVPA